MKKLIVLVMSIIAVINLISAPVVASEINNNIELSLTKIDGKRVAYNLLHTDLVKLMSEDDIIRLYYKVYMNEEATDWDVEFWKERITKEDTTLLTYGMINSNSFTGKCEKLGVGYDEYFIEDGVFTEGISDESVECGLTANGDYVFYATFGNSTYYHVVYGANEIKR